MHLPESRTQAGQSVRLFRNSGPFNFLITEINHQKLIRLLFRATGILVIIHLINLVTGGPSWQIERLFALGEEANVPTWFSSLLWFLNFFVAYRCSRLESNLGRYLWFSIAALFLSFSIDETAMIHENIFAVMNRYFPLGIRSFILEHFKASNWPIIASPFLVVTVIWLILTFRKLLKGSKDATNLLLVGFITVIFGGWALEMATNVLNHNNLQWIWEIENVFEESLEMVGAIIILSGLFKHYEWLSYKTITLRSTKKVEAEFGA